jgi:hypothetical protein
MSSLVWFTASKAPPDLDGRLADAAAAAEHQHHLARLQARARQQHVPRGEERQRKGRRLDKADGVGNRDQILDRHAHVLGIAAVALVAEHVVARALVVAALEAHRAPAARQARLQHHPASGGQRAVGGLDHFAGDVSARDVRQRDAHALDAAALPDVEEVQGRGADAHHRLARTRLGHRGIFVLQHLSAAVTVKPDCLHIAPVVPGTITLKMMQLLRAP